MKNALLLLLTASLLTACGRTDTNKDNTQSPGDSVAAQTSKSRNCQSVVTADKLGKPFVYKESAKPITFTLTLDPDTSTTQTPGGCYVNNTITVLATRKKGQLFKRTLNKDDLALFAKNDEAIAQSVLQTVTYKPTFTGERYFNLTMQLIEPVSKKTTSYTLFMNYYGEIVKVR